MTGWMLRTLHHWVGAAFAAFFFLICVSGVWLTLSSNIGETLSNKQFRQTVQLYTPAEAIEPITSIAKQYGPENVTSVSFPRRGRSAFLVERTTQPDLYLNQDTMVLIAEKDEGAFSGFMRGLHVRLLAVFGAGEGLVIATGLIVVYLVINGLIIFVPVRRSFDAKAILGPKKHSFAAYRRSHISTGLVMSGFIILFGLTGWIVGEKEPAMQVMQSFDSPERRLVTVTPPSNETAATLFSAFEGSRVSAASFQPQGADMFVKVQFAKRGSTFPDGHEALVYQLGSSNVTEMQKADNIGMASVFAGNADALHTGSGLGWFYQFMLVVTGAFTALMTVWALASYGIRWSRRITTWRRKWARRESK